MTITPDKVSLVTPISSQLLLRLETHTGVRNGKRAAFIEDAIADALDAAEGIAGQRVVVRLNSRPSIVRIGERVRV